MSETLLWDDNVFLLVIAMAIDGPGSSVTREDLMYIDHIKKFIKDIRRGNVENIEMRDSIAEIIAVDASGAHIAVRLIGSRVPISDVNTEVTHVAHEVESLTADLVYLAIPSKKLIYMTKRTREILSSKMIGLLEIRNDGEVIEVIPPRKRTSQPPVSRYQAVPQVPKPIIPVESQRLQEPVKEQAIVRTEYSAGEVEGEVKKEVPDFIKDNPWLNVLSKRRGSGA